MTAVLERARVSGKQDASKDELGKPMIVTRDSGIPEDSRVIERIAGAGDDVQIDSREDSGRGQRRRR